MIKAMGMPPKTLSNVLAGGAKRYYNLHWSPRSNLPTHEAEGGTVMMISFRSDRPLVIKVRDIERSRQFYTDVMGLKLMMEIPKIKMAFSRATAATIMSSRASRSAPTPRPAKR